MMKCYAKSESRSTLRYILILAKGLNTSSFRKCPLLQCVTVFNKLRLFCTFYTLFVLSVFIFHLPLHQRFLLRRFSGRLRHGTLIFQPGVTEGDAVRTGWVVGCWIHLVSRQQSKFCRLSAAFCVMSNRQIELYRTAPRPVSVSTWLLI